MTSPDGPRVALISYSVKPRGGVVHTLAIAEALRARGQPVHVFALGDPGAGFYRPVHVPHTIFPAPAHLPTLEERVFASIDALEAGLAGHAASFDILHTQDCIAARAACRVRDADHPVTVVRTVHHVDDFSSQVLIECQRRSILEPDAVFVVSKHWQNLLRHDYGVQARVVHNGVDVARFRSADPELATKLRQTAGATGRPLLLSVGGIEPRKGTDTLARALSQLKQAMHPPPTLAIVGGHSFQDHAPYRDQVLGLLPELGLVPGEDVIMLGTVPDEQIPGWYAAADVLAFPSVNEGWGLAVLEAMSAGLPVVASDIPVFGEYLKHGQDALLVPPGDARALRDALSAVLTDPALAARLQASGRAVAQQFTWSASAAEHQRHYQKLAASRTQGKARGSP